ncbi:MAG TPA: CHAP domain-containing protein [Thermopolyspora sp.]
MNKEIQKYLDLIKSQVGYSEQSGGYTKFGDWYGKTVEFDSDYSAQPWCDMFLSWAAYQLGYQKWVGQFAYTPSHAKWFQQHDAWGGDPQVGALVFYDWSGTGLTDGIDHVGIVTEVDGKVIHTVEGNIDGGYARTKVRDQTFVVGYGYPEQVKARLEATAKATAAQSGTTATHTGSQTTPMAAGAGQPPAAGTPLMAMPLLLATVVVAARLRFRRDGLRG